MFVALDRRAGACRRARSGNPTRTDRNHTTVNSTGTSLCPNLGFPVTAGFERGRAAARPADRR